MLHQGLEVHYKTSLSDVVSAADHASEEKIIARLTESRPDDGLVGEEGARKAGEGRTWYVDPVDGTYNFLSGIPYWCSAVGLVDADGPLLGAVYYPALDQLWLGGRDHSDHAERRTGARAAQPRPLRDLDRDLLPSRDIFRTSPPDCVAVGDWPGGHGADARIRLDRPGRRGRAAGSASSCRPISTPWDWYPGAALVLGAGGVDERTQSSVRTAGRSPAMPQAVEDVKTALQAPL